MYLMKRRLLQSLRPSFQHGVERFQSVEHAGNVPLSEIEPGGFFQPFVPQFMPQNGHANQFFTDLWNKGNQSRLSDAIQCQNMNTIIACWTRTGLCSHMLFKILLAAL